MAIRVRAMLRKWFGRGMYPTAEQFSDLFDSFWHKTEDEISMDKVGGLTDQLNGKYPAADGKRLEERVTRDEENLADYIEQTDEAIDQLREEDAAIRKEFAAADEKTLASAKTYTDGREAAIRKDMTAGDAATLASAKAFTTEREGVLRKELQDGDAETLQAAKDHTAARETAIRSDMTSGDASTLASAKEYVDKAIEQILNGSPEALDTLKELADALGNDPNFAATVTKQLGQKVDKVTGKGLSTEDYTTADKQKLAGIAAGANNYQHPASHPATMISEDATHRFVTDTEKSAWSGKADKTTASASAAGLMSAADKKKLDGVAAGANNYVHPDSHPATMIAQDETHRFITDAERKAWNEKPGGNMASTTAPGLMSAADKKKLDGVATGANNYVHPASHPATMIQEDASHRFVSDTEKSAWNNKASTALASQSAAGLMSAADKKKLDGLPDGEFVLQCTIPGME